MRFLVWSWLEELHFSCIDWVIESSHMVVFCRNCSRLPSMFLSRNLFTGWLKIYLCLLLSVICSGQKWLAHGEGRLSSAFFVAGFCLSLESPKPLALVISVSNYKECGDSRIVSWGILRYLCNRPILKDGWGDWSCKPGSGTFSSCVLSTDPCPFPVLYFGNKDCISFLEFHSAGCEVPDSCPWFLKGKKFLEIVDLSLSEGFPPYGEVSVFPWIPTRSFPLRLSHLFISCLLSYKNEPFLCDSTIPLKLHRSS